MTNKIWLAVGAGVALVTAGAVAVAFAADWGGHGGWMKGGHGRGHHDGGRGAVSLLQYDTNKDGAVTRAEIDAGIQAQFRNADTNADGHLDAAEFQKYNDARRAERKARIEAWRAKKGVDGSDGDRRDVADHGGQRNFDPMKHMDWNLDGYITPEEFGVRTRTQAMRADRNADGTIQPEEMKKGHRGGRGHEGDRTQSSTPDTSAAAPKVEEQ